MEIGIGILGYGGIGQGVVKTILDKRRLIEKRSGVRLVIRRISYRSRKPAPELTLPEKILTQNPEEVVRDPNVQIVVELIGGYEPARSLVLAAFEAGKHVVTANKAIAAKHLVELIEAAGEKEVNFAFEASVAASIPIIHMIQQPYVSENILSLYGILNGTSNYILTRMSEGMAYEEAVRLSIQKGFAEPDPSFDVEGRDSAQKLVILASLLYNTKIHDDIYTDGITDITRDDFAYAADLGYSIKLLAIARRNPKGLELRVHPTMIPNNHVLSDINDEYNAILIRGDNIGPSMLYGLGAGQQPTASMVVSDIVRIAGRVKTSSAVTPVRYFDDIPVLDTGDLRSKHYIRYGVVDKVGILAKIAKIIGEHNVSIAGVWQKRTVRGVVSLVMTTHEAMERDVYEAVREIDSRKELVKGKSLIVRIDDID